MKHYLKKWISVLLVLAFVLGVSSVALAADRWYTDIFVDKNPDKMTYQVGESFDFTGMVLKGNGKTAGGESFCNELGTSRATFSPEKFTKAGNIEVTISIDCAGKSGSFETFTTKLTVKVTEKTPDSWYTKIAVGTNPKKMTYKIGEKFDPTGMTVNGTVMKSDNSTTTYKLGLQDAKYSPATFTKAGNVDVTITIKCYAKSGQMEDFTTKLTVKVEEGVPVITKDPTKETVDEGGSCKFIAKADGADTIEWFFHSPDGKTEIKAKDAYKTHPGITVTGYNKQTLALSDIPYSLNGWKAFAEFSNNAGSVRGKEAKVTVNPAPEVVATPSPKPTVEPTATPGMTPAVTPEPTETPAPVHEHAFATEYVKDEKGHSKPCACGETIEAGEHTFTWTTSKQPTKKTEGEEVGRCVVCGYLTTRVIPAEGKDSISTIVTVLVIVVVVLLLAVVGLVVYMLVSNGSKKKPAAHKKHNDFDDEFDI